MAELVLVPVDGTVTAVSHATGDPPPNHVETAIVGSAPWADGSDATYGVFAMTSADASAANSDMGLITYETLPIDPTSVTDVRYSVRLRLVESEPHSGAMPKLDILRVFSGYTQMVGFDLDGLEFGVMHDLSTTLLEFLSLTFTPTVQDAIDHANAFYTGPETVIAPHPFYSFTAGTGDVLVEIYEFGIIFLYEGSTIEGVLGTTRSRFAR